ncbi:MAG: DUF429 domain-containing protein [Hyphomicrobiaceae bacterium]
MEVATGDTWVAGADGCRGGWLVVLRRLASAAGARAIVVPKLVDVLELECSPAAIGVDIPIGLPERVRTGGRAADVEARAHLGARKSAVFPVPARRAVMQSDYRAACDVALACSDPPRKVSKQCFHLFPKIREVDEFMRPELQSRIYECHPELGFWALNGERPLDHPKKRNSLPWKAGLEHRTGLLERAGYERTFLEAGPPCARAVAGLDDFLDAAVCSWSAARIVRGSGRRFPHVPEHDARGLRMEIWC